LKFLLERIWLYLTYFFQKVDGHSLQGPYSFNFYTEIIKGDRYTPDKNIERKRSQFLNSKQSINYHSYGTVSQLSGQSRSKISRISERGISSFKKSRLLHNIITKYNHHVILELGTSLGINTSYLAKSSPDGIVYTFEGHVELCEIASSTFNELGFDNVKLVEGNITDTLPVLLNKLETIDFAFMDANHRSEYVLAYFNLLSEKIHERSVIVVDDIRWNQNMYAGWKNIVLSPLVSQSFDLGNVGIVTFEKNIVKRHYKLTF